MLDLCENDVMTMHSPCTLGMEITDASWWSPEI